MAGRLVGRSVNGAINSSPHAVKAQGHIKSNMRTLWYYVDYLIGTAIRIRPVTRSGVHFLIDRGWADMVVDFRRYGLNSNVLSRMLLQMLPQPDLVVVVSVPPLVAWQRKAELPVEEIERQYRAWSSLVLRAPIVFVNNDRASGHAVREILDLMNDNSTR